MRKLFIGLFFLVSNTHAGLPSCPDVTNQELFKEYSSPQKLADYWSEKIGKLYNAIPKLSPQEEKWLNEELKSDSQRFRRATESSEYSIQRSRQSIDSIDGALKVINGQVNPKFREPDTSLWALVTYSLLDSDLEFHLEKLEKLGVIKRQDIPERWTIFATGHNITLADSIRMRANSLAQHILICIIPQTVKKGK
jgi:hypothetical protein